MSNIQKAYLGTTPLFREKLWYENSPKVGTQFMVSAVTITADSSANTKGAWTQLISSTEADSSLMFLNLNGFFSTGVNTASLLDIAFGASGAETPILENLAVGGAGTSNLIPLPIKIPSGTRISARIQSVVSGGKTGAVIAFLYDAGNYNISPTSLDVIGGNTTNSQGISFSGSSGTWVEAISSTTKPYKAVAVILSIHSSTHPALVNQVFSVGIGSAGNEAEFGTSRQSFQSNGSTNMANPQLNLFGYDIPAGSRLAVKHPFTSNPDRYGFCLICIP
jgi:hypothetical protein